MDYMTGCLRCGATFRFGATTLKGLAAWRAGHRCAKLPEVYWPKHLKISTKEKTWESTLKG